MNSQELADYQALEQLCEKLQAEVNELHQAIAIKNQAITSFRHQLASIQLQTMSAIGKVTEG